MFVMLFPQDIHTMYINYQGSMSSNSKDMATVKACCTQAKTSPPDKSA